MNQRGAKYVNPLTDFGFKKLFGEEPNKDILISFLNELLPEDHTIEDLQYAKNERLGNSEVDRKAIYDLYCTSTKGERFIVELQKAKQNYFRDRSIFYSSFPIQEQAEKGDWDYRLEAVYTIGILDFIFDDHKDEEELYHLVELKNQRNEIFYDKLKYIYVELPKFKKTESELETDRDKWFYVFRHLADLDSRPARLRDRIFERVFEVAQIGNFTQTERDAYEASLKYYRDIKNVVDTSREEGIEEGIERGIEEGIERGIKKGIGEGFDQAISKVALSLLQSGMPITQISEHTGLTPEQIRKLS